MHQKFSGSIGSICSTRRQWNIALTIVAALGLVVGCGGSELSTGTVSGTVTHDDGPLTGAYVNFFNSEHGTGGGAPIGANGEFAFDQPLRVGEYIVTIVPPSAPPPLPAGDGQSAAAIDPPEIPDKYRSEATSDLRVQVEEGENSFDLALQ